MNTSMTSENSLSPNSKFNYQSVKRFVQSIENQEFGELMRLFEANHGNLDVKIFRQMMSSHTRMSEEQVNDLVRNLDNSETGFITIGSFLSGMHWLQRGLANTESANTSGFYSPRLYNRAVTPSKSSILRNYIVQLLENLDESSIELLHSTMEQLLDGNSITVDIICTAFSRVLHPLSRAQAESLLRLLDIQDIKIERLTPSDFIFRVRWMKKVS
eukprot:TRINITY_DN11845_c0_g2_i1.p1 TRINITY_DN11845_c0_g2~~TRINITY_DN11845_c0_g2_i1.p1  ORF type:complete len:215 (-),score=22.01 TRINITY_DN11845_c0_g2_i1:42-686(-)